MDDMKAAAKRFAALGALIGSAGWTLRVHERIGQRARPIYTAAGGTMQPWSKRRASTRVVRLRSRYEANSDFVKIVPTPPGLWAIKSEGAHGHNIGGRRANAKILTIPGSETGYAKRAHHPGRGGVHNVERARREIIEISPSIVDAEVRRALGTFFTGG